LTFREDSIQTLVDLGLTESQAEVYFALLRTAADSKAATIAKFSGVARQDTYRLLSELQHLGLVQKIIVRPAKFRAVPAKAAIGFLLTRKTEKFSELKKKAQQFAEKAVESFGQEETQPEDQFVLVTDRDGVICKVSETWDKTKKTVSVITPFRELFPWLATLSKTYERAISRGVQVRWIAEEPEDNIPLLEILRTYAKEPNFTLKLITDPPKVKVGIHDKKYTIIGLFADHGFSQSPALWSNSPALAELAESYFDGYWKIGIQPKP
jgi:sugar-specific transcriptional regulator TrmB